MDKLAINAMYLIALHALLLLIFAHNVLPDLLSQPSEVTASHAILPVVSIVKPQTFALLAAQVLLFPQEEQANAPNATSHHAYFVQQQMSARHARTASHKLTILALAATFSTVKPALESISVRLASKIFKQAHLAAVSSAIYQIASTVKLTIFVLHVLADFPSPVISKIVLDALLAIV